MSVTDSESCKWCEAIQAGRFGIFPTFGNFCEYHQRVWIRVASAALCYQLRLITKAKWVAELRKAKADGARISGVIVIQPGEEDVPKPVGRGPVLAKPGQGRKA